MKLVSGQYAIRRVVLGEHPFIPISDTEFAELDHAFKVTSEAMDLEEKFDVLLGNFFSLEKSLLEITLKNEVWHNLDHATFQNIRREINRKLLNLLSTCRLYQDSKAGHLKNIFGNDAPITKEVIAKNSEIYDASFSFRFMEALRNYAQHRAFAVSGVTLVGRWIDAYNSTLPHLRRQGISFWIDLSELDNSFKSKVLKEATQLAELPDFKLMVREYVDGIRKLHAYIREAVKPVLSESDHKLSGKLEQYKQLDKCSDDGGIAVIKMKEPPAFDDLFYLFSDRTEYRKWLLKKNHTAGEFSKSYISSEILQK